MMGADSHITIEIKNLMEQNAVLLNDLDVLADQIRNLLEQVKAINKETT